MRVARLVIYEGDMIGVEKQLSQSLPEGIKDGWSETAHPVKIHVIALPERLVNALILLGDTLEESGT